LAEEIEIVNVGGEGVASEATLLLLLRAMDKGGKSANEKQKIQEMYNKTQKDGLKIMDTGNDTSKKNNKNTRTSTFYNMCYTKNCTKIREIPTFH